MYEDDDGGFWIDTNANYYGELDYFLSYKGEKETPMKWLYLDFKTLMLACETVGLKCDLILEGEHYDYLACLRQK
ncbi:putative methyltransferase [Jejuia pallidilutea]|nr:putative methyltransferase [Jejuia pallidilutea]